MGEKDFGGMLEACIRESGYTNYEFAKVSGVNRVSIQRYLAGTRLPDVETFEKIVQWLRLGGSERRELFERYKRAADGDSVFFMRKNIRDMLEHAGDFCGTESGNLPEAPKDAQPGGVQVISGALAVERYVWAAIIETLQKTSAPEAYFYIPAERYSVSRFLPSFYADGKPVLERLRIIQAVRLTKRSEMLRNQYHNIQALYHLIPAYYQAGKGLFTRFYYYDCMDGKRDDAALYPYYGILEDRVVLFSEEMDQAVAVFDEAVTEAYKKRFLQRAMADMQPLVNCFADAKELLEWYLERDGKAEWRCFLEYQPCVAAWMDRPILEQVVNTDVPEREELIEALLVRREHISGPGRLVHYFTETGLREFVETGICADYPPEYVRPLTKIERARILDGMIADMGRKDRELGIIDGQYLCLTRMLNVFVSSVCGTSLILYDERGGFKQIVVEEASICQAFEIFIRGMREHREVRSEEETLRILKWYRERLE